MKEMVKYAEKNTSLIFEMEILIWLPTDREVKIILFYQDCI